MFGFIKDVALLNIQSHKKSIFAFDGARVHRISATGTSNSFGKSVLRKSLIAVFTPFGKDLEGRKTLINRDGVDGYIIVQSTTGLMVTLYLHLEEKYCYYELEYGDEVVRKYLRDDYDIILQILGFHFMKEEGYSLNFYKTKTTLPFTHFSPRLNYKVRDSASELPHYQMIIKEIEEQISLMQNEIRVIDNLANSYKFHIESLEGVDMESLIVEEKMIDNWIGYLQPIEIINEPMEQLANARVEIENLHQFDLQYIDSVMPTLESLSETRRMLNGVAECSEQLSNIRYIDLKITDYFRDQLDILSELNYNLDSIYQSKIQLEQVDSIPVDMLPKHIEQVEVFTNVSNGLFNLIELLDSKVAHDEVEDLTIHTANLNSLSTSIELLNILQDSKRQLEEVSYIDTAITKPYEDSLNIINSLSSGLSNLLVTVQEYNDVQEQIEQFDREMKSIEQLIDVCPSCGQLILDRGHEHGK